jgi:hypothetical protein
MGGFLVKKIGLARPKLKGLLAAIAALSVETNTKHTMNINRSKSSLAIAAMVALPILSWAGTAEKVTAAEATPAAAKPSITGNLSLNLDSHFISFGSDVWGGGDKFKAVLFHPSLELNKAVTDNFKLILGTWWDVNDQATQATTSAIGKRVQEVDVWLGGAYTSGIFTTTALYQQWMYGGANEQAGELKFSVDTLLKPSLLIHERFATGYKSGTVAVLSASYDLKAGPVSVSFPLALEWETKGYHTGGKKAGVGYGSVGITGSVPADFISKDATFSVGVTGYATDKDLNPSNPKDTFLTYTTGISIPF